MQEGKVGSEQCETELGLSEIAAVALQISHSGLQNTDE